MFPNLAQFTIGSGSGCGGQFHPVGSFGCDALFICRPGSCLCAECGELQDAQLQGGRGGLAPGGVEFYQVVRHYTRCTSIASSLSAPASATSCLIHHG